MIRSVYNLRVSKYISSESIQVRVGFVSSSGYSSKMDLICWKCPHDVMWLKTGVEAVICLADVSTFTSRTGEFVYYRTFIFSRRFIFVWEEWVAVSSFPINDEIEFQF